MRLLALIIVKASFFCSHKICRHAELLSFPSWGRSHTVRSVLCGLSLNPGAGGSGGRPRGPGRGWGLQHGRTVALPQGPPLELCPNWERNGSFQRRAFSEGRGPGPRPAAQFPSYPATVSELQWVRGTGEVGVMLGHHPLSLPALGWNPCLYRKKNPIKHNKNNWETYPPSYHW